ncbi:hypothetical protein GCM10020367_51900 [Streptomyces sannanensis]|uniref:Uncharacterized protein n=1 Tax=Streptomyces sannanensis TaxID=285536 RepID=A0ABP6SIG8_9ACTN
MKPPGRSRLRGFGIRAVAVQVGGGVGAGVARPRAVGPDHVGRSHLPVPLAVRARRRAIRPDRALSGESQVDPGDGVPRQQITLGLDESVLQREPQPVLVGGQDDGLDRLGTQLPRPVEPARIDFLTEPFLISEQE